MKPLLPALLLGLGLSTASVTPAAAYPVDCAILLCLAGGWPASAECAHARAVFIARITPWPVEPPLQIWNCPMRAAYRKPAPTERLFEANAGARRTATPAPSLRATPLPLPVANRADVDISEPAFDFVRSIKVWHVEYRHHENRNGDCNETDRTLLGSYGLQGDYSWTRSSAHAAPAWMGIRTACTRAGGLYRGVGVEWVDHRGKQGHELVRY